MQKTRDAMIFLSWFGLFALSYILVDEEFELEGSRIQASRL